MHSRQNCLPGVGLVVFEELGLELELDGKSAPAVDVNRYVIQKDNQRLLVYYWYDSHGRTFASEYKGKFYLIWDTLRTGRTDGALVRVMVPGGANTARSDAAAMSFSQLAYPALAGFLADYTSPTKPPASDLH